MRKQVRKTIAFLIRIGYRLVYRWMVIDTNRVLFLSFHGRGYLDNPRAIHEYMIQDTSLPPYQYIWVVRKPEECTIPNAKIVKYLSISYFYQLAKSKYWIVNCKLPDYLLKKSGQVYLQTWHGTPLKKLAHDIDVKEATTFYRSGMSVKEMKTTYDVDVQKYTYMVSPSTFTTKVFQSAFKINKERLLETGYPRNDKLSTYTDDDVKEIKNTFHLPTDKKIILYAPTWRDNSYTMKGYTFALEVDFDRWQKILGEEYIILFKPHYLIVNTFDVKAYQGFVYSIDPDADIRELYIISDILITDYSSVFFDYAILERPIYFYMYDKVSYEKELRGFYLDVDTDLPGKVYEQEEALLYAIAGQEYAHDKITTFNQRFNSHEDGLASKRVVDAVFR